MRKCRSVAPSIQAARSQLLGQPDLIRLSPVEIAGTNVRREADDRREPAGIGVRDTFLLRRSVIVMSGVGHPLVAAMLALATRR
jgi:hypothetical protein